MQKPKEVTRMLSWMARQRESMRATPLGFLLKLIVNEKIPNLEKTTSRVLSVFILIYVKNDDDEDYITEMATSSSSTITTTTSLAASSRGYSQTFFSHLLYKKLI